MAFRRFVAGFVALTFAFSGNLSVLASENLRPRGTDSPPTEAGLEERLRTEATSDAIAQTPHQTQWFLKQEVDLSSLSSSVVYPGGKVRDLSQAKTVLITADAGYGKRWADSGGILPKVVAEVAGFPAGWRTKQAAEEMGWPVISIVSYEKELVKAAFDLYTKNGIIYVEAERPNGGTSYAFYYGGAVYGLRKSQALVIASAGDQPLYDGEVLETVQRKFLEGQRLEKKVELVIATALFDNPKGKGRIVRDREENILGILEQADIDKIRRGEASIPEPYLNAGYRDADALDNIREGNVSIYAMPAEPFFDLLENTTNGNAQRQFYVTDIVGMVIKQGGIVEAIRIPQEKAPDLTTVADLAKAERFIAEHGLPRGPGIDSDAWMRLWATVGGKRPALKAYTEYRSPATVIQENPEDWIVQGRRMGQVNTLEIQHGVGRSQGTILRADPKAFQWKLAYNPDVTTPRWVGQKQTAKRPKEEIRKNSPLSRTAREILADPSPWLGKPWERPPLFSMDALQVSFWSEDDPDFFLVVDGQVVHTANAKLGGKFWVFVLEPGPPRLERLTVEEVKRQGVRLGISGPALRYQGEDLADQPERRGKLIWDPNKVTAAFSAIGATREGELLLATFAGDPRKQPEITLQAVTQAMAQQGAVDLLLLGGSMDAQMVYTQGDRQHWILGRHRSGQHEAERPLNAFLLAFSSAGLEQEISEAMERWFGPESTQADEKRLVEFLAGRGETAIDQFVRLIEQDRGLSAGALGPYRIPPFDRREIPAAGQFSAGLPIPSTPEAFEMERLRLMAQVAIQRALERQIVVNVGIGFVGATVMIANSQGQVDMPSRTFPKSLKYRAPIHGKEHPYFVLGYQRPSTESYFKIEYVNKGRAPITTADPSIEEKLQSARRRENIQATFLKEAVAVADIALVDTELHVRKLVPRHLELSRADPGPTLKLLRQVGALVPKETLVIVETTVYPGFTLYDALPVLNEALRERGLLKEGEDARLAYTFQRVEPGPELFQSLMTLERVGAGVTQEAREGLRRYYETVGFNYRIWDDLTAVELLKDVENAYRFGLIELMGAFLRGAEISGVNAFDVIEAVAQARPKTHGTIRFAPALQVGGYCIPKELVMVMWGLQSHFGLSELKLKEIFFTRLASAVASDFRAEQAVYRLMESLAEAGLTMEESRILWLGLAYNPGVADTRYSGTERGLRLAAHHGARNEVTDPYVRHWPEVQQQRLGDPESWGYGLLHQEDLKGIRVLTTENPYEAMHPEQDAFVLATRHPQYVGQGQPDQMRTFGSGSTRRVYPGLDPVKVAARMLGREGKVILDSFNFLSDQDIRTFLALGWKVRGFGKGQIDRLTKEITVTEKREAVGRLLHELVQLNGTPGISREDLEAALQATSARLEYLEALESNTEKNLNVQWAQARYEFAKARQEARTAKPSQQPLAQAKVQWSSAQVQFFGALLADAPKGRSNELEAAVDLAYQEVQQLSDQQRKAILESARRILIQPAQGNLEAILRRAAELIQAFRLVDQGRTLVPPDSVAGTVQMAESYLYLRDRVEDLSLDLDRAFEELVTPEGKALAATAVRKAQARPELAFPQQEVAVVYAQGEDGKLRRWVDPQGHPNRLSVKTVKDMAKGKAAIPKGREEGAGDWSKYSRVVPLNLVPADGIELEAYPDFQELPWEFRQWLLTEVLGKGYVLSTMDGLPQDRFGYAMDVNLDPKTVARGRGGILFFSDTRQPLALTTEGGHELIVDLKAVGPYGGGPPAGLGFTFERVTSTGMVAGGGVGRMQVGQVPGHMTSAEEIPRLHRLMRTEEAHQGKTPRPLFRVKWRYRGVPDIQFQMIARASPTNQRIGQILIGGEDDFKPDRIARIMGENAALVLTQPIAGVHEGLNGDNIMMNGHYTDLAGLIDLFNERDPYGAFYKYFGFYLQLVIYSFEEISRNDTRHPDTRYVGDWLRGFLDRFLAAGRGTQVRNPERFRPFYQSGDTPAQPTALIEKLIRTIWEQNLPYHLLKNRLEIGYDPTEESIYSTGDVKTLFHPESASAAREFIEKQRQLLTIAQRLIREERYDPLPFDFPAAYQELDAKARRIEEIAASQPSLDQPAYAEIYRLSFYPSKAPEIYPVLSDVESIMRGEAAVRLIQKIAEPTVFFDKSDVTAQAQLAARKALEARSNPTGLEEPPVPTLRQWQAVLADPIQGLELMKRIYPESEAPEMRLKWLGWIRQVGFDLDLPTVVVNASGRATFLFGRHIDYLGFMGGSLGFPTLESIGIFVQEVPNGNGLVEVYGLGSPDDQLMAAYPEGRPRLFGLDAPWLDPEQWEGGPITRLEGWDRWAEWVKEQRLSDPFRPRTPEGEIDKKINYADDLIAGVLAFLQTPFGDPSGRAKETIRRLAAEKKDLRIAILGDLPPGGQASSSAIVVGTTLGLNRLYGWGFGRDRIVQAGFAERHWAGTAGGYRDHAMILYPPGWIGVFPVKIRSPLRIPSQFQLLSLDTGISREQAKRLSRKMQQPGNSEDDIRQRTGIGYALSILWLRENHPELEPKLGPYDDGVNPYGLGRELLPAGAAHLKPVELLQLLREIPEGGLTREELRADLQPFEADLLELFEREPELPLGVPRAPYHLREMFQFGLSEEARNGVTVELLEQLALGLADSEEIFRRLIQMTHAAHDGDRVAKYEVTLGSEGEPLQVKGIRRADWSFGTPNETLDGQIARGEAFTLEDLALGKAGVGSMERSIEPIDLMVDLIEAFNRHYGGGVAAGVIAGAGLGGRVTALVKPEYANRLQAFLQRAYYEGEAFKLLPEEYPSPPLFQAKPPIFLRPGNPASVLTLRGAQDAGGEEPSESPDVVEKHLQTLA